VTIDVEEYFHIEAAYRAVGPAAWNDWPSRVGPNVDLLLDLFAKHDQKGTWFILGDVARRSPGVAKKIADAGHEVASHGTGHDRLHRLNPASFRDDLLSSKKILEDQTGRRVVGYRAPTFSVVPATAWAIDVLVECGFEFDASIFPVVHPAYGVPSAPDRPFFVQGRESEAKILEVPPLTWAAAGRKLAVAGGGYFRLLPLWFMKRGLAQARRDARPAVLYFHPWEFDPDMPRMPLSRTGRLRTYTGLKTAARKLDSIMAEPARWSTIAAALPELRAIAEKAAVFAL
jgi:polysaccharide deacetylase family protein (PEP-CTERM system associated)